VPHLAISILLLAELALLVVAWYRLQAPDIGVADALCRSLGLSLAGLGFAILTLFLAHLAHHHWILDALVVAFAGLSWRLGKRTFGRDMLGAFRVLRREPLFWFLLALACVLSFLVLAVAPTNFDSMAYNLARVLLMHQENSLDLANFNNIRQVAFNFGFDLLHFFFLRVRVDYGIAAFSFMAYGVTVLGSYVLAKAYAGRAFGLRVAVVIACLKPLLLQAVITKNDLGAAAMAVSCIVAARSLLSREKPGDMLFFLVCLAFGLSTKSYFMLFAAPFLAAFLVFNRAALKRLIRGFIRENPKRLACGLALFALLVPLGLSSQILCEVRFGNPFGPPALVAMHRNQDGLAGTLANVARYAAQIPDLPGRWWSDATEAFRKLPVGEPRPPGCMGSINPGYSWSARWDEDLAWFGLIGGFLIFPAVLAGLGAADRFGRSVSFGLCGYFLLISVTLAWMPWNSRFFTLFFASSATCLACWRKAWHARVWLRRLVLGVSMAGVLPALIIPGKFSQVPAFFSPGEAGRIREYSLQFDPQVIDFLEKIPSDQNILLLAGNYVGIYPLLLYGNHHWVVVGADNPVVRLNGRVYDTNDCRALLGQGGRFDLVITAGMPGCGDLGGPALPWRLVMRAPAGLGIGYVSVYDPHAPAVTPAP